MAAPSEPGSQTLPSCHHGGSQLPRTHLTLRLLRPPKQLGPSPSGRDSARLSLPLGRRGRDRVEVYRCLRPGPSQWTALERTLELCRAQPPACSLGPSLSSPTGPRPDELEDPRQKAGIQRLPYSPPDSHHSTNRRLNLRLTVAL